MKTAGFSFAGWVEWKRGFSVSSKSFVMGVAATVAAMFVYDKFIKPNM
tara:strand:+ start:5486 stop:5629 length:144 start_codon:yes stop_codon:yes gene_type:complete